MRGPGRGLRALFCVVFAGTAVCAALPAGGSAESSGELERRADALRAENAGLRAGAQATAAGLVAIEQRLAQTRAELAAFQANASQVKARRQGVANELGIARSALRLTQRALARRLQAVYEQGDADTLALLLGAGSLDAALDAIETMDLAATQDEELIAKARFASKRLVRLAQRLADRERELQQLAAARAAAAASLADARAERLQTIAAVRSTNKSNSARIAELDARARGLAAVPAPSAAAPLLPPSPAVGVRSLTVVATGYALPGHTASGSPVGWGAVAVDPSVIPLGSRLNVPGYGLGVAADTGGAIRGARIDLWFPSVAQAHTWGSRLVTVTVYSN